MDDADKVLAKRKGNPRRRKHKVQEQGHHILVMRAENKKEDGKNKLTMNGGRTLILAVKLMRTDTTH
ncbi:hypothetical protein PILCRDRAFT_816945 [Piloderma croceum F 1598]|uniref:Uncharacterized protein n=1 Tax=Piloderma croceum (strain F 1598) TaxID=765440 RepID=A0A0C3BHF5_PILCF|nr:hypothetical protein PILCRDRAFT_816945 [Piloderma croceum F 1598]